MASQIKCLGLILLVLVALAGTACSDREPFPTLVPLPTYTPFAPLPTYTPLPTHTPVPTAIPVMGVQKKEVVEKIVVHTVVVTVTPLLLPTPADTSARMMLSSALGIAMYDLKVYSIESLEWSDASLGCPKTGYSYAQVITPGYRITFDIEGVYYRVHTNLDGSVAVLCDETPTLIVTAQPAPTVVSTVKADRQAVATAVPARVEKTPAVTTAKPPRQGGRPEDRYACSITSEGYCIFSGIPHGSGLKAKTEDIVDRNGTFLFFMHEAVAVNSSGKILQARGTPAFNGDELIKQSKDGMTDDEKAFHRVMAIMFPIRNALMYDIADLSQNTWDELVSDLNIR